MAEPKNAPTNSLREAVAARPALTVDFRQYGRTGLNSAGGYVFEERLRALQGSRGMDAYREMGENDSTIATSLGLIERAARQAPTQVDPASQAPHDLEAAEFLEQCLDDMELPFSDTLADQTRGTTQFGFYLGALQYKRRAGDAHEPYLRSKYRDGRIGWRSIVGMAPDSIQRWNTEERSSDTIVSVTQCAPPLFEYEDIPYDRLLHIRQSTHKNNPLGQSVLRGCFRDWFIKVKLESFAAIGAERSVAGMPVIRVPPEVLAGITDEDRAMLKRCQDIATGLRVDENGGIVFPMARDQNGQLMYDIELMSTNSNQLGELTKMISLLDYRIAATLHSEFTKLGESGGSTGSYAMHSSKTDLHAKMINNLLSCIADTYNRFAIPRLFALNNFQIDELPKLSFGEVGQTDLKDLGGFLQSAAAAGAVLFPNPEAEERIMELAGLPPLPRGGDEVPAMPPMGDPRPQDVTEVHEGDEGPENSLQRSLPFGGREPADALRPVTT